MYLFGIYVSQTISAQWSSEPAINSAVCTAIGDQTYPKAVSDGAGGVIIAWNDSRNGNEDIYAQRINASGVVQWATNGVAICTAIFNQNNLTIVSDGTGGAIITWQGPGNGSDIYAQRINASGVVQWTTNGVEICAATNNQFHPTIVSDGSAGAIITWYDLRYGTDFDIFAQRINASGVVQWIANGVAICTAGGYQMNPTIISDGAAGAIITWQDHRTFSGDDIYVQRIDAIGVVQWTANGVAISTASGHEMNPSIISDGASGAIISWSGTRDAHTGSDVYAQRINATGIVQWAINGIIICSFANNQFSPAICTDAASGAIIVWIDLRNGGTYDIYAQRINVTGVPQWLANGVPICTLPGDQSFMEIVSDNAGGFVISWIDYQSGINDVYAQRINTTGTAMWTTNGIVVCNASGNQNSPTTTSDGAGGAIISWLDFRNGTDYNIYAQNVNADGTIGICNALSISNQPLATQTICQNTTPANLIVTATGNGLTYQWYSNTTNSNTGGTSLNPAGTSSTYTPSTTTVGTFYYYCVVTNSCGTVTSNVSTVIVNALPAIPTVSLTQPTCNVLTGTITINAPIGMASYTVIGTSPLVPPVNQPGLVFAGLAEGAYNVTATNSGGCTSAPLSVILKLDKADWAGAIDDDWHNAGNWNTGLVPTATTHVYLLTGTPPCRIKFADAHVASIQIQSGSILEIFAGWQIIIHGNCIVLPPH